MTNLNQSLLITCDNVNLRGRFLAYQIDLSSLSLRWASGLDHYKFAGISSATTTSSGFVILSRSSAWEAYLVTLRQDLSVIGARIVKNTNEIIGLSEHEDGFIAFTNDKAIFFSHSDHLKRDEEVPIDLPAGCRLTGICAFKGDIWFTATNFNEPNSGIFGSVKNGITVDKLGEPWSPIKDVFGVSFVDGLNGTLNILSSNGAYKEVYVGPGYPRSLLKVGTTYIVGSSSWRHYQKRRPTRGRWEKIRDQRQAAGVHALAHSSLVLYESSDNSTKRIFTTHICDEISSIISRPSTPIEGENFVWEGLAARAAARKISTIEAITQLKRNLQVK